MNPFDLILFGLSGIVAFTLGIVVEKRLQRRRVAGLENQVLILKEQLKRRESVAAMAAEADRWRFY